MPPELRPPPWTEGGRRASGAVPIILGVVALLPGLLWLCGRCWQKRRQEQPVRTSPRRPRQAGERGEGSSSSRHNDQAAQLSFGIRNAPAVEKKSQMITMHSFKERPMHTSDTSPLNRPMSDLSKVSGPVYTLARAENLPMTELTKAARSGANELPSQPTLDIGNNANHFAAQTAESSADHRAHSIGILHPKLSLTASSRAEDVNKHPCTSNVLPAGDSNPDIRAGDNTNAARHAGLSMAPSQLSPFMIGVAATGEDHSVKNQSIVDITRLQTIISTARGTEPAWRSTTASQVLPYVPNEAMGKRKEQQSSATPGVPQQYVELQQTECVAEAESSHSPRAGLKLTVLDTRDAPFQRETAASSCLTSQAVVTSQPAEDARAPSISALPHDKFSDPTAATSCAQSAVSRLLNMDTASSPLQFPVIEFCWTSGTDSRDCPTDVLLRTAAAMYVQAIIKQSISKSRLTAERLPSTGVTADSALALTRLSALSLYYDCECDSEVKGTEAVGLASLELNPS